MGHQPDTGVPQSCRVTALQAALCALLLAGVLLCRLLAPPLYARIRQGYGLLIEQQDLSPQIVRFANAAMQTLSLQAAAAGPPAGCSGRTYVPAGGITLPVRGFSLSSGYGWRRHPITKKYTFHRGVDLACAEGTPVCAALDGTADTCAYSADGGNWIRLRHTGGVTTSYFHLQYVFVRAGEPVKAGQVIGTAGHTGNATGPHLHFALQYNDVCYDPSAALGLG